MERDERGWPIRTHNGVRVCARKMCDRGSLSPQEVNAIIGERGRDLAWIIYPPSSEFRINGYCSEECQDTAELEEEIARLHERAEKLETALREAMDYIGRTAPIRLRLEWRTLLDGKD